MGFSGDEIRRPSRLCVKMQHHRRGIGIDRDENPLISGLPLENQLLWRDLDILVIAIDERLALAMRRCKPADLLGQRVLLRRVKGRAQIFVPAGALCPSVPHSLP